jgi:diguanylate cyclase (GGDEF)-like protein/PAS domain S-box-containing protein
MRAARDASPAQRPGCCRRRGGDNGAVRQADADLSEERAATLEGALAALREAEERFRLAFEHAPIGVALVAPDGSLLEANEALCRMLGYSHGDLYRRTFQELTHPDDLELDVAHYEQVLAGAIRSYQLDKRYLHADGHEVWATLSVALVRDEEGSPLYFVSQMMEITDRKRREAELQRLADHDPLTGLHNRRSFVRALERERLLSLRHDTPAALLLLDLDGFKAINDTYGHACGDEVLQAVAERLRTRARRSDVAGRLGGDEFALLLVHATAEQAEAVAAKLRDELAAIRLGRAPGLAGVRACVGIAAVDVGAGGDDVLAAADDAMYAEKRAR